MRQPQPVQQPPDRRAMHFQSMVCAQHRRQFINRQIRLRRDPAPHPLLNVRQLAVSRIALRLWLKRPGLTFEPHHVVDELDRYAQAPGRLCMRVSLFNKRDGAFSQLNRMRLTHL